MDNLRKHHIIVIDWCCMCKKSGKILDHLIERSDEFGSSDVWYRVGYIFFFLISKRILLEKRKAQSSIQGVYKRDN
jgi:hypothetical protein